MLATASRYARLGFCELLPEHITMVEQAEARYGRPLKVEEDRSLGAAVIFGRGEQARVLLIEQKTHTGRIWCLPKGHPEALEDDTAAALREVFEETGVRLSPSDFSGVWQDSCYTYAGAKHGSAKKEVMVFHTTVRFALALLRDVPMPALKLQEAEVAAAEWLSEAEAVRRVKHEAEKLILGKFFEEARMR